MEYFDRIEKQDINGNHDLFAIDDRLEISRILRDICIQTCSSASTGHSAKVNGIARRDSFSSEAEMQAFEKEIGQLARECEEANHRYCGSRSPG
jgi:hypothetical protein